MSLKRKVKTLLTKIQKTIVQKRVESREKALPAQRKRMIRMKMMIEKLRVTKYLKAKLKKMKRKRILQ